MTQPEWLQKYLIGLADPGKWSVLMEGVGYAVIRRPGVMYWNGHSHRYSAATQWLVTKGINYWNERRAATWEGHITKAKRQEMTDALEAREGP